MYLKFLYDWRLAVHVKALWYFKAQIVNFVIMVMNTVLFHRDDVTVLVRLMFRCTDINKGWIFKRHMTILKQI